jgi:myo-inositol-1(or 4)-monophosphatase
MLEFARRTIEAAGAIAMKYFRQPIPVENKAGAGSFDPVTRADREIESFIRGQIGANYPGHAIVGEEGGLSAGRERFKWFIDPIDGTKAFISGAPMWGLLLGLMEAEVCRFGLVHQPFLRETYLGSTQGAYLYQGEVRRALAARGTGRPADAILYCTHPSMFQAEDDRRAFQRVAEQCKLMRYGGDCYSYCLLTLGFIDVIIEAQLKPHDVVPLIPIIEAAGGRITEWAGGSAVNGGKIVASANARLHDQILTLLQFP